MEKKQKTEQVSVENSEMTPPQVTRLRAIVKKITFEEFCDQIYPEYNSSHAKEYLEAKFFMFKHCFEFFLRENGDKKLSLVVALLNKRVKTFTACMDCKWFYPEFDDFISGLCHRFPPASYIDRNYEDDGYQYIKNADFAFCGEFQERKVADCENIRKCATCKWFVSELNKKAMLEEKKQESLNKTQTQKGFWDFFRIKNDKQEIQETDKQGDLRIVGTCHRFPPVLRSTGKYDFPQILESFDNECGEYQEKKTQK